VKRIGGAFGDVRCFSDIVDHIAADGCVKPAPANVAPPLAAPAIAGGDIAPTAKSFKLDTQPKGKSGENIPLKSMGKPTKNPAPIQKLGVSLPDDNPVLDAAPIADSLEPAAPVAEIPPINADYPSDRVRALVEMAVAQALAGQGAEDNGSIVQPKAPDVQPAIQRGAENVPPAPSGLIPSCGEGEFLTVNGGEVVCRRAASAGKMACPPAVLRTYVDWHDQHIHFHVPYTPHGQTQTTQENSDVVKVECNNGKYKMLEITRNECGGNVCKEGRAPAYSMTFYCHKDKTDRCYAKQNGRIVNHTYSESYINKQY